MTPEQAAISVEEASSEDVSMAVDRAIRDAGTDLTSLRSQAAAGRFQSERARLAWFAISPFFD
jgi:hypothetical protein